MDQNNGKAGILLVDYAKPNYNGMQSTISCSFFVTKTLRSSIGKIQESLRKYPHNEKEPLLQLTNFLEGLSPATKDIK